MIRTTGSGKGKDESLPILEIYVLARDIDQLETELRQISNHVMDWLIIRHGKCKSVYIDLDTRSISLEKIEYLVQKVLRSDAGLMKVFHQYGYLIRVIDPKQPSIPTISI